MGNIWRNGKANSFHFSVLSRVAPTQESVPVGDLTSPSGRRACVFNGSCYLGWFPQFKVKRENEVPLPSVAAIYIYKILPLYYDMNASERLVLKRKVFIKDLVSRKYWMSRSWRGEMTSSLSFAWPGSLCSHGFRIEPNHCHQSQYFLCGKWLKTPRHMSTHFVFNATLYYWNIYFQYISRWVW